LADSLRPEELEILYLRNPELGISIPKMGYFQYRSNLFIKKSIQVSIINSFTLSAI